MQEGEKYRVVKEGAYLELLHPINQVFRPQDYVVNLPVGAIIAYTGRIKGWGSDNVWFDAFDYNGKKGSFYPNFWGAAEKSFLEAVPQTADCVPQDVDATTEKYKVSQTVYAWIEVDATSREEARNKAMAVDFNDWEWENADVDILKLN